MKKRYWLISGIVAIFCYNSIESINDNDIVKLVSFDSELNLKVRRVNAFVLDENGIGSEWSFYSYTDDGKELNSSYKVYNLDGKKKFVIRSEAIESDPNHDDIGESRIIFTADNLPVEGSKTSFTDTIKVDEYYGDGAGNTATCVFEYSIEILRRP